MTNNIIGPIDRETFYTLHMLRQNVREMGKLNTDGCYDIAIHKQKETIKHFFDEITGKVAA